MKIGYARVSTIDQDLAVQRQQLKDAGCEQIHEEKMSGTTTQGRDELATALRCLRPGDVLCITRIDRLARSLLDLLIIVNDLKARGVSLLITQQSIDTRMAEGEMFLKQLGIFAEYETNLRRERQLEGIVKAKAKGVYKGRPATVPYAEIAKLFAAGLGASAIAKRLRISRASVYRGRPDEITDRNMTALEADGVDFGIELAP
jgi:DNA invertase Pin-like site-specific DNA recombinase